MKFSRRSEDLTLDGQTVTIQELSAAEFSDVMAIEDDLDQVRKLLQLSLQTTEDVLDWPNHIVTQLTSSVMALNGLTEQGN